MNTNILGIVIATVCIAGVLQSHAASQDRRQERKRDGSGENCTVQGEQTGNGAQAQVGDGGGRGQCQRKRDGSGNGKGQCQRKRDGSGAGGGNGQCKRDGSGGGSAAAQE